ncbi:hypothetical protein ACQ4PT_067213 [Festuca glaucescens]
MEEATAAAASAASSPSTPQVVKTTLADDLPRIRLDWKERLVHGLESTKFTVEVHHGGYFVGSGQTISYLDEKSTVWFDNLDRNTFNIETLCSMIDQLGYEKRRFIFWCPPGKAIDELMEVVWLKHCKLMAEASVESKVLVLFLHHPDDNEQQVKDELSHGESSEDSEKEDDFQCDSDEDPAWHDSDYDMKEDDELFVENVDDSEVDEMVDKGKQNSAQHAHVLGVDDVNEVDLELPVDDESERRHKSDSDDEEYKKKKKKKLVVYKFKAFNSAGDMNDPKFKTGMIFDSVEVVRKAVSQYAINERVQIRKKRNNQKSQHINWFFGVESHGRNYVVELSLRACSCRRWQLTGIPCSHSIACMRHERIKPESMVSSCYSMATYMQAYGGQIFPLRDKDEWAPVDATPILPPLYEKCVGRRKKNRRKQPEESEDGTRLSKHGTIIHCGYCKKAGHNRGGCSDLKAAIIRENDMDQEEGHGPQPTVHQDKQDVADFVAQQPSMQTKGKSPATQVEAKNTSSRGRKRKQSSKMREHVEQLMEIARRKKSKQVIDENGDIDYPVIRTHINQKPVRVDLDPQHQEDFMVHILGHEGAGQGIPLIMEEIPEESSFVAEHKANIPAARGPLVSTSTRALGATGSRGAKARGARGARVATGARGSGRASTTGRKRSQDKENQEEFQSTQGAPGYEE